MKVGILTYHWIYNYGGQLQALATAEALRKLGHEPVVIHFIHTDLREGFYERLVPKVQQQAHIDFAEKYLPLTKLCTTEQDLIDTVDELGLKHILIGSDAVFFIKYPTSPYADTRYPSIYWMRWIEKCKNYKEINVCSISASSMETNFRIMPKDVREGLKASIDNFSRVTVRDRWTKWFLRRVSPNTKTLVTPDPVMSMQANIRQAFLDELELPISGKYILYGLQTGVGQNKKAILEAVKKKVNDKGYKFVALPFPEGSYNELDDETVKDPVNPLLWYKLIQNASGVFSEKFHPIVVSMHNKVPFFAIDGYGDRVSKKFIIPIHMKIQSKTYDLCKRNGFKYAHLPVSQFTMDKVDYLVDTLLDKKYDFSTSETRAAEFTQVVKSLVEKQ